MIIKCDLLEGVCLVLLTSSWTLARVGVGRNQICRRKSGARTWIPHGPAASLNTYMVVGFCLPNASHILAYTSLSRPKIGPRPTISIKTAASPKLAYTSPSRPKSGPRPTISPKTTPLIIVLDNAIVPVRYAVMITPSDGEVM